MGCVGSKVNASPLVRMCKERKEFIKAAVDCRYALASAHISYLQSFLDVGDALSHVFEEGIIIGIDSPYSPVSNHQSIEQDGSHSECLPSDIESGSLTDGSHSECLSSDIESETGSLTDVVHGMEEDTQVTSDVKHMIRSPMDIPNVVYEDMQMPTIGQMQNGNGLHFIPHWDATSIEYGNGISSNASMGMHPNVGSFHGPIDLPSYGNSYGQYENKASGGVTVDFVHNGQDNGFANTYIPSPPKVPNWDSYLDPFGLFKYNYLYSYYTRANYEIGYGNHYPDFQESMDREEMPNLEDETLGNINKRTSMEMEVDGDTSVKDNEITNLSLENDIKNNDDLERSPIFSELQSSNNGAVNGEDVCSEVDDAFSPKVETLRHVEETTLAAHCTRNLQDVLKDINDPFKDAFDSRKEVLVLLEGHKLPYLAVGTKLKVIYYRILGSLSPSLASSLLSPYPLWKQSASETMKMAESYKVKPENDSFMKSSGLLLIIEELYLWEKRLYKEVTNEEKLQVIYKKACKRLKSLDDKGAEPSKIDAARVLIKRLLPKINVAVTVIDAISGKIHKLRDEELLPQVFGLIHGLMKMWQFMFECHKKQFQAIMEAKTHIHVANFGTPKDLSLNAIMELEIKILTWGAHFSDLINIQKVFVKSLNGWLLNFFDYEPEKTPDGIAPFSPGKLGAPAIFIICNDWYQALETITDTKVLRAIHGFASSLHQILENQNERHHRKNKVEYSSEVTKKQLKSLCKIRKINGNAFGATKKEDMQQQINDEETKQSNNAGSSSTLMVEGLVSIFEALENFSADAVKAYEQIRVSNGAAVTH